MVPRLPCQLLHKPFSLRLTRIISTTRIHSLSVTNDVDASASALRSCAQEKAIIDGRHVHSLIIAQGWDHNKLLGNLLVHMYGSCGALHDARHLFVLLSERDTFAWNFMISAYVRHGFLEEAFQLFDYMRFEEIEPDGYVLASILSACAELKDLTAGKHIHTLIIAYYLEADVVLVNSVINLYAKCGLLEDARFLFDRMDEKIDTTWNAIISGYVQNDQGQNAIMHYRHMMMEAALPTKVTFISIISTCTTDVYLFQGKQINAQATVGKDGLDIVMVNALINMYGKCGDLQKAQNLFDSLSFCSIVTWNAIIASYVKNGSGQLVFQFLENLHQESALPNRITFRSIMPVFDHTTLQQSKRLHVHIADSLLEFDTDFASSLIYMYGKCGSVNDAYDVFEAFHHDILTWNAVISVHSQHACRKPSLHYFQQMLQEGSLPFTATFVNVILGCANKTSQTEGKSIHALLVACKQDSSVTVGIALLNMYGKCGDIQEAKLAFRAIPEQNVSSWTAMIAAYAERGDAQNAILLFEQMQWEGIGVDKLSTLCVISACSNQMGLLQAKYAHTYVLGAGLDKDMIVQNALVSMYSKCGSLYDARKVFNNMPQQNLISWTAKIAACAQHGQGKEAFCIFENLRKEGKVLDEVIYAEILVACSHCGLIDEAIHVFVIMRCQNNISPTIDHFNCLIDLFTRVGRLDFAEHVISNLPSCPDTVSWLTILGGCRIQNDLERGEQAAKQACDLSVNDPAPFITLSNLYAGLGRFNDAAYVMNQMWVLSQQNICNALGQYAM